MARLNRPRRRQPEAAPPPAAPTDVKPPASAAPPAVPIATPAIIARGPIDVRARPALVASPRKAHEPPKPLHKQWAFWAIAGGLFVGAVTAVIIATRPGARALPGQHASLLRAVPMIGPRARPFTALVFLTLLPLLLAGCRHDITEVALVVQSDLEVPADVEAMDVAYVAGPFAPQVNPFFGGTGQALAPFPLSVGFESGGMTTTFSITVRLFKGLTSPRPRSSSVEPSPTSGSSPARR